MQVNLKKQRFCARIYGNINNNNNNNNNNNDNNIVINS